MKPLLIGNAPCSWGTLEFDATQTADPVPYDRMLDELAATGYTGTELGDWGYMPEDPAALHLELHHRRLTMLGAFVPVDLKQATEHASGVEAAVMTAKLLAAVATEPAPYLVLADANGTYADRLENAGRITPSSALTSEEWDTFAAGANHIAKAVRDETGLRTVFHHHCAGYVETPAEIATFLDRTDPSLVGLVFDTGHFTYGAGPSGADIASFLNTHADRIWYLHFKDCSAEVAAQARAQEWDYFTALQHGVFCELGKGSVDFNAMLRWIDATQYDGYIIVEQDVLPGLGSPRESARRNREYLRKLENAYAQHQVQELTTP